MPAWQPARSTAYFTPPATAALQRSYGCFRCLARGPHEEFEFSEAVRYAKAHPPEARGSHEEFEFSEAAHNSIACPFGIDPRRNAQAAPAWIGTNGRAGGQLMFKLMCVLENYLFEKATPDWIGTNGRAGNQPMFKIIYVCVNYLFELIYFSPRAMPPRGRCGQPCTNIFRNPWYVRQCGRPCIRHAGHPDNSGADQDGDHRCASCIRWPAAQPYQRVVDSSTPWGRPTKMLLFVIMLMTKVPITYGNPHLRGEAVGPDTVRPDNHYEVNNVMVMHSEIDHNSDEKDQLILIISGLGILVSIILIFMMPAGGAHQNVSARMPPSWDPSHEARYSFRSWTHDLLVWSILATSLDPGQQASAIIIQLGGSARELMRNLSLAEITQGGTINGVHVDPVTYLLSHLAAQYAPLGEESRLQAISELMQFTRQDGERIDALLARFLTLRVRATQGGAGMAMSWEGYSWLLTRACHVSQHQLLSLLQPFQGRFPADEAEFNNLQMAMRRMGHILEGSPNNIASQLRAPPAGAFFTGFGAEQPAEQQDPWATGPDPWGGSGTYAAVPTQPSAAGPSNAMVPAAAYWTDQDSGTDSDTISSVGNTQHDESDLIGLTGEQRSEQIWWAYEKSKSRWRKLMNKPTRKTRRFIKKNHTGPKGKGKQRFAFLGNLSDEDIANAFYGKGNKKGW